MTQNTVNYNWIKPDIKGSADVWGGYLNADLDGIDAVVKGIQTQITSAQAAITAIQAEPSPAVVTFESIAAIQAATIPTAVNNIECLSYGAPGDLQAHEMRFCRAIPTFFIYNFSLINSGGSYSGYHIRQVIQAPLTPFGAGPYNVVVTLQTSPSMVGATLDNIYIGMGATTGNQDNFDGSQVQLSFNGGMTSLSGINGPRTLVSDPVSMSYVAGRKIVIAFHWTGAVVSFMNSGFGAGGIEAYFLLASSSDTGLTIPAAPLSDVGAINFGITSVNLIPATFSIPSGFVRSEDNYLPNGQTNALVGGYWLLNNSTVTPKMFGAYMIGTSDADDYTAISAALLFCQANGNVLHFPRGRYYSSQTLTVIANQRITGEGMGIYLVTTCTIQFPLGVGGMVVVPASYTLGTYGVSIEGLDLIGTIDPSGGSSGANGITASVPVRLHRVNCHSFGGHGFQLLGFNSSPPPPPASNQGSVDLSRLDECNAAGNQQAGFHCIGQDANVITFIKCSAGGNGWVGFWDDSFLGCNYISCHAASNGNTQITGSLGGVVNYGGIQYGVVPAINNLSTKPGATTPGTDSTVWFPIISTTNANNWVSGGQYNPGGPYCDTNLNARTVWLGCYAEATAYMWYVGSDAAAILGGLSAAPIVGPVWNEAGSTITGGFTTQSTGVAGFSGDSFFNASFGQPRFNADQIVRSFQGSTSAPFEWREKLIYPTGDVSFSYWDGTYPGYYITGPNTTWQFGSGVVQPGVLTTPNLGLSNAGAGIVMSYGTAPPTTGSAGKGWIVFNTSAAAGGTVGWVCTTAGTNGSTAVWKTFGAISA